MATVEIAEARPADIPSLSTILARAFHPVNPYIKRVFPDTPAMREWWSKSFDDQLSNRVCHLITAIDPASNATAVGLLCLRLFGPYEKGAGTYAVQPLTPDHDEEGLKPMLDGMALYRERLMTGKPHMAIELFAVDNAYARQGIGKRLLAKACEVADKDGYDIFVQANGSAEPFYGKYGFEVKGKEVMPGADKYEEYMLVRPCKKL